MYGCEAIHWGTVIKQRPVPKENWLSKQPSGAKSSSAGGGVFIAIHTGMLAASSCTDLFTGDHGHCGFMSAETKVTVKSTAIPDVWLLHHSTFSSSVLPEPRSGGGDLIEMSRLWLSTLTSCDSIYNLLCVAKKEASLMRAKNCTNILV